MAHEPLARVTDVDAAMQPDAPVLHAGRADESVPAGMSPNVMARCQFSHGDIAAGLVQADRVPERSYTTEATHQGYIEAVFSRQRIVNDLGLDRQPR